MDEKKSMLQVQEQRAILQATDLYPAEPLWKRVPVRDEHGLPLTDFMMIIPGLNKMSSYSCSRILQRIEKVLHYYSKEVFFADMNMKINVLWVSLRQRNGACVEVAAAIHAVVPEAKLVAEQYR